MASYSVEFTTASARELRKLEPAVRRRLVAAISGLETDPRPARAKKLVGYTDAWRLRVGDYRILYEVDDSVVVVTVVRVAHRREVYERL